MRKIRFFSSVFCGCLILAVSLYGYFLLDGRLDLPPDLDAAGLIKNESLEVRLGGTEIQQAKDVEFIISQNRMEGQRRISLRLGEEERRISLVPFYAHSPFPVVYLIIGLFCVAVGLAVFILRPEDNKARIFFWGNLAFSSAIIIGGGYHCLEEDPFSFLPGLFYYFLYPLAPALLFHFSRTFSGEIRSKGLLFVYVPALFFSAGLVSAFLLSIHLSSIGIYRFYQSLFYFFRFFILIAAVLAIAQLVINHRKAVLEVPKAQLKWILYGLTVGLAPFLILYQFPQVLKLKPLVSEESSIIFFILIPLAFAFSIVKFKLMDIEIIIHRSLVYGFLTIFTVSLYLFSVYVLQNFLQRFFEVREMAVSAFAAVAAAAAFHPARKRIQEFVDKSFYRLSYDYRQTIHGFNERAQRMAGRDHLLHFFLLKLEKALPLEHAGVSIHIPSRKNPTSFIQKGCSVELEETGWIFPPGRRISSRKDASKTAEDIDFSQEKLLEKKGLQMILPLPFRQEGISGCLTLGKKMSGERFSREDLELLRTMAGVLVLNLERIKLQEEVIRERTEKEKLDELNRLKTEFISSVSHELRTPISSIQGITELLKEGKVKDEKKRAGLMALAAGESTRLSHFLHNILDFGKIELQTKSYRFERADICRLLKGALSFFQARLEKEGFSSEIALPGKPILLMIDKDAVKEALINLMDNAIKYSRDKREIKIEVVEMQNRVAVRVKDRGIGIPPRAQERIFDKFYRHPEAADLHPEGVGLGLKIVKHIIEAHKGEIKVSSRPQQGSTFSLFFPKP